MSELDNCCGTTCDKQKLSEEINALKAQVEQFRIELEDSLFVAVLHGRPVAATRMRTLLDSVPVQCLAEIRAQAGHAGFLEATAFDWNQYSEDEIKEAAEEYSDKIRRQAKGGDL